MVDIVHQCILKLLHLSLFIQVILPNKSLEILSCLRLHLPAKPMPDRLDHKPELEVLRPKRFLLLDVLPNR